MRIISQQRVRADSPEKLTIRCSLTDVFVRDVQVSVVFLYAHELDTAALARGLGRVLGDFAPFNARLRRRGDERFIECGDNGASLTVARSDKTLAATVAGLNDRARLELVDVINARGAWSNGDPVVAFRVTHFAGGGSALGVSWHHTVGDLHSVLTFMRAWSSEVAGVSYDKPLLVEDRDQWLDRNLPAVNRAEANLRYMQLLELSKLAGYMITKGRDKRRITMYFDPDELERMRFALQSESGQRLSINDALSAHVSSIVSARDIKPRNRRVSISVNFRKRVGLPSNVLGNMVTTVETACEWGKPAARLAADLRGAIDDFADKHLNHRANLRLVQSYGGFAKIGRFIPTGIDPFAGSLLVSSWSGFDVYKLDFGGAAPSHFLTAGSGPLPWLGVVHEGFHNRGRIVDLELPGAVTARMLDAAGQRELHRYRESDARPAQPIPAWLS
jgi:hypothetical protein